MKKKEQTNQERNALAKKDQMTEILITDYFDQQQKTKWNKILEKKHGVSFPQKKRVKRIQLYRTLAVAASLLLLVFAGNFYSNTNSAENLVAQYLEEPFPSENRKGIDAVADKRKEAIAAISAKEYLSAIKIFEEITQTEEAKVDDYFYLGLSYLYHENAEKAVVMLLEARTMKPSNFLDTKDEINWYLALAYFQDGDKENAKKELKNFINQSDFWNKAEAQALLDKL